MAAEGHGDIVRLSVWGWGATGSLLRLLMGRAPEE